MPIVNFHQDFVARMHNNLFQGQIDRGLLYRPKHSRKLVCSKQEVIEEKRDAGLGILRFFSSLKKEDSRFENVFVKDQFFKSS